MAQSQTPDVGGRKRLDVADIDEGDTVFMAISLHGVTDDVPGTEYDDSIYHSGVEGEVVENLSDGDVAMLKDGKRPLADLKVETESGEVFTWNVDNGYVLGYNEKHDMHTDVGKYSGLWTAE